MKFLERFSPGPEKGIGIVRIIVGLLLVYHGHEVFRPELMNSYLEWDQFKTPLTKVMMYAGKWSELIAGVLLTLGLFTRVAALIMIGTVCYITFFIGSGRFWYEDQHPFMFALFGLLFFFTGGGAWRVDRK